LNKTLVAKGKAPINIVEAPEALEDDDILEMVNAGLVDATVVNDFAAKFWSQVFPNLKLHTSATVAKGQKLAIGIRKHSPKMMGVVNTFVKENGPRSTFGNMMDKRYLTNAAYVRDANSEAERKKLLDLVKMFQTYGDKYNVDALLMAAQGYQESRLDQNVKSKVGAIGIMQVMPKTGKELAVGDISKIEPNIHAGVKYFRFMVDQFFKDEPMDPLNKGLMTLASYNAGPNRIRQLRKEAEKRGLNPNVWFGNVERVVAERVGSETVTYVSNIYKYYVAYKLVLAQRQATQKARESIKSSQ
jgi:membrane-bound lytic murein transglycosylase MltF